MPTPPHLHYLWPVSRLHTVQSCWSAQVTDFVRRRRWIRTRVPLALAAKPRTTTISADAASWATAGQGLAALADSAAAAAAAAAYSERQEAQPAMAEPAAGDALAEGEDDEQGGGGAVGDEAAAVQAVVKNIFAKVCAAGTCEGLAWSVPAMVSCGSHVSLG
jgi:hypothetical protein